MGGMGGESQRQEGKGKQGEGERKGGISGGREGGKGGQRGGKILEQERQLTSSSLPSDISLRYLSATSSRASSGHSLNQSMVVQLTKAGYIRIRFLKYTSPITSPVVHMLETFLL